MGTIDCDCGTTFEYEVTGSHGVGNQPMHTHPSCSGCGAEWTIRPDTGVVFKSDPQPSEDEDEDEDD